MTQLLVFDRSDQLIPWQSDPLYADLAPAQLDNHQVDWHLLLCADNQQPLARCSLWWRNPPPLAGEQPGLIGHFAAMSQEAAQALLLAACQQLANQGCSCAIGPMDGNSWRRYRWLVESSGEPPFFLEPVNPPSYPHWFRESGFEVLASYSSALNREPALRDQRVVAVKERLVANGVSLRCLDPSRFDDELAAIHRMSLVSFAHNFLYTPLAESAFIAQYQQLKPLLDPRLVVLAEAENQLVGYLFALPNFAEQQRGEPILSVVAKTVAVLPGRRFAGLGAVLLDEIHQRAAALGYQRVFHALMHDSNNSRNLSGQSGETIRRYHLYWRKLTH